MPKRLSEELKDLVVADYLSGVTTREIINKHKTHELYKILKERKIEYKQDNDAQKERNKKILELYLKGEKIQTIENITNCKCVDKILKKNNIPRKREPKKYNTNKKDHRNKKLIQEYLEGTLSILELSEKYSMTQTNIYRILKVYNIKPIKNKTHHWVINKKLKEEPKTNCRFYILEDYFGYTKIGITTKKIKERFNKNVKVFFELEKSLEYCYHLELKLKKELKKYIPKNINKKIDGWSECYYLSPEDVQHHLKLIIKEI